MDKCSGKPPSLEEKKALPNCGNKDIHHVPHCCSQTESDHGWERDIEAVLDGANREDEEDHDDAPLSHTTLKQEWENMCGIIWPSLGLLQTSLCLLSMNSTTCKTIKKSKTSDFRVSHNEPIHC